MLYSIALMLHNALRWLVLFSLLGTLASAFSGLLSRRPYTGADQILRIVTTSIAHTQLLVGFYLYAVSPVIRYYWREKPSFTETPEFPFFALIHISLMLTAVVLLTIGSSKAKRQPEARQRFRTTAFYFSVGLLLILVAVPWPFSPLAARPWFR